MKPILHTLLAGTAGALLAITLPTAVDAAQSGDGNPTWREFDTLVDVFLKVRDSYVDETADKDLIEGAIRGMLQSLDPHSSYLNARDSESMRTQTDGEYGGLGLTVQAAEGAVKVVAPTDDTPAARAGMKSGDFITHIDDQLIIGMSLDEAVDRMRGAPGTKIKLTVIRPGEPEPLTFNLVREMIHLRPVKAEAKGNVGVIRISTFNRQTGDDTRKAVTDLTREIGPGLAGFVLDLRSNPGGLLDQAVDVSDVFLERGEIVSQRGRSKDDIERYYARRDDLAAGKPIVVLVDGGSASAAEIVAGALQDQKRALVIGERTFGKGSVQTLIPLSSDTALRLTTARYYTPSGKSVQEAGIEPNIVVPQLTDPVRSRRQRVREADLRNHLLAETKADDELVEDDGKPERRFDKSAEDLEKAGIKDFQLYYAVDLVSRLAPAGSGASVAVAGTAGTGAGARP